MLYKQEVLYCLLGTSNHIKINTRISVLAFFFQSSFFPTMPQDDLDLIKDALLNARPDDGSENPVFHSKSFCILCFYKQAKLYQDFVSIIA